MSPAFDSTSSASSCFESSQRDRELETTQARPEAAEKRSQDFEGRLRLASMEMDELRVEAEEPEDDGKDGNEIGEGGNAETDDSVNLDQPIPQAKTNEESGNREESTSTKIKKRKTTRRSGRAGERMKSATALTGDQPTDMTSPETLQIIATSQAEVSIEDE
jgi:hypothetical protein